ncbi:MAG: PAS domain S-box protein [Ignavibacteria bacterium]|jgi:PAS domain S-box-containing protein|nr:PAS domain S-box protein [Ignavibacteria bacterium]MCU7497662.1 PAS domain S-box protein [Ignavibacteria bacterium]MCU7511033.1 PAS domain S-box protein [Ignavibacteria bacterium]MCU7518887.1 PAS domain S-box protein [Ignavibacteria bacterium]MCU7523145.1 PAS domain S-box protein [Ignavibacteria bacterium]
MAKAKIFIVEDESIVALDLKYSLESLGYQVCGIESTAEDGVKKILEAKPQLVLMDIGLEGVTDGITAAAEIKSKLDIPLIYLTANSDEATLNRAKITEPFGYVLKPFDERDLQTTIEMALYKYDAESRLKSNERWFSTTLKSIGDAVITTDLLGKVTFMNVIAEELTGFRLSEALGRPLEEVFHIFNENTLETMEHPVAKVIRDGVIVGLANHSVLRSKTGAEIPIDDSASPIKDEKGAITGVVLVFRDIKERKTAENALRQSEENARNMIELSPYAILVHSGGKSIYCNEAAVKLVGAKSREDVVGEVPMKFVHPDYHKAQAERIRYMMATGGSAPIEEEKIVRLDGTVIDVEVSAGFIMYEGMPAIQTIIRDNTERKRSQEAIALSEERYRTTFENTGSSIVIVEENGIISLANSEFCRTSGYSKEEIEGKLSWIEVVHPDDRERIRGYRTDRLSDSFSAPHSYEYKFRDKWGHEKYMINTAALIPGTKRIVVGMLEITERKKAEEEIQKSEKLFRLVWENSADGMRLADRYGNVKMVNEAFCRLVGMQRSQMEGKPISIIYHEDLRGETISGYVERVRTGTVIPHSQPEITLWNGKRAWFDVAHSELVLHGQELLILSVFRDITERRKSEERLAKLNDCMLSFGADAKENINRLVALCGEQLSATSALYNRLEGDKFCSLGQWNTPEGFCTKDDAAGHVCYDVIHGDKNKIWVIQNLDETNYADSDPNVVKYGLKTYIGKQVACYGQPAGSLCLLYRDDYAPSRDDLRLLSIAATAIGVEEKRKRAEEELILAKEAAEKADRLKSDFLAQMSHEIRTPINTILSFTSLLRSEFEEKLPDEMGQVFKIIDSGGRRLTRTIDMILSMSQLQSGSYEMNPRKLNLRSDILDSLFKEFENQAKMKDLEFLLSGDFSNNDEIITGDPYSLTQMFQNLIDNAIKYTQKGGVEISLMNEHPDVTSVIIEDTGIGISEDYLPKIFSPFSQEETGYTRRFEGNGLGLALVKKYADLNSASVKVESQKGKGTKVTVTLKKDNN